MRTIEFRGMRFDEKGWAEGSLLLPHAGNEGTFIIGWNGSDFQVKPETVGQFTGLCDKNGVKVFEGDLVEISTLNKVVGYSDAHATFTLNCIVSGNINVYNITSQLISVIGNIHTP